MKNFISKLAIAIVLSMTLVVVTEAAPYLSHKYRSYRSARMTQIQSGPAIPGSSYSDAMNNLLAGPGR